MDVDGIIFLFFVAIAIVTKVGKVIGGFGGAGSQQRETSTQSARQASSGGVSKIKELLNNALNDLSDSQQEEVIVKREVKEIKGVKRREPVYRETKMRYDEPVHGVTTTGESPYKKMLSSHDELKKAFVLKEILDRPVSERL